MNYLVLVLRLIHIVAGVFWVGGAMLSTFFLSPAVAATGEAGQKIMGYMVTKGRISVRMTTAAILTVLAGLALYWIDSAGLTSSWTTSAAGWGFGIGGLFAVIGMGLGMLVGRNAAKLGRIASAAQGKPTQAQMLEMESAQRQMSLASQVSMIALIISVILMATARYWGL